MNARFALLGWLTVAACTHIVTDPLDVPTDVAEVGSDARVDSHDVPGDVQTDPGIAEPTDAKDAVDATPDAADDQGDPASACAAACGGGTCPEGQCCEQGLCHAQDPDPPACGWYVPGQQGLDEMCRVKAGGYYAGCDTGTADCPSESQPRVKYQVTNDVFVDRFEVTNLRYQAYLDGAANAGVAAPDCKSDGTPDFWDLSGRTLLDTWRKNHPVVCVSAPDAEAYCTWRGKHLPTEAQWEAAARGTESMSYPWGASFDTHKAQCYRNWEGAYSPNDQCADTWPANTCEGENPNDRCQKKTGPVVLTAYVCSIEAGQSPFGLCHAAGNAAEWVADGWESSHDAWDCGGEIDCADPFVAPKSGGARVVRGGSWNSMADEILAWARESVNEGDRNPMTGFRCSFKP